MQSPLQNFTGSGIEELVPGFRYEHAMIKQASLRLCSYWYLHAGPLGVAHGSYSLQMLAGA